MWGFSLGAPAMYPKYQFVQIFFGPSQQNLYCIVVHTRLGVCVSPLAMVNPKLAQLIGQSGRHVGYKWELKNTSVHTADTQRHPLYAEMKLSDPSLGVASKHTWQLTMGLSHC